MQEDYDICFTCGGCGMVGDTTYLYTAGEDDPLDVETYGEKISESTVCPDCFGSGLVRATCGTDEIVLEY